MILHRFLEFMRENAIEPVNWMIARGLYTGPNNFVDIPNAMEPDLLPVFLIANERARLYQLVEDDPKIKVKDVILVNGFRKITFM